MLIVIAIATAIQVKKDLFTHALVPIIVFSILGTCWLVLLWLAKKSFDNQGFALREHDIIIKKGWLFEKLQIVPLNKVQHTQRTTGPLERFWGLSSIQVYTAGASDATIHGLAGEDAEKVKSWLTMQIPGEKAIPSIEKEIKDDNAES